MSEGGVWVGAVTFCAGSGFDWPLLLVWLVHVRELGHDVTFGLSMSGLCGKDAVTFAWLVFGCHCFGLDLSACDLEIRFCWRGLSRGFRVPLI